MFGGKELRFRVGLYTKSSDAGVVSYSIRIGELCRLETVEHVLTADLALVKKYV